jgi:hypothetical protein
MGQPGEPIKSGASPSSMSHTSDMRNRNFHVPSPQTNMGRQRGDCQYRHRGMAQTNPSGLCFHASAKRIRDVRLSGGSGWVGRTSAGERQACNV